MEVLETPVGWSYHCGDIVMIAMQNKTEDKDVANLIFKDFQVNFFHNVFLGHYWLLVFVCLVAYSIRNLRLCESDLKGVYFYVFIRGSIGNEKEKENDISTSSLLCEYSRNMFSGFDQK